MMPLAIAPGINLWINALQCAVAKRLGGKDPVAAMPTGHFRGYIAIIEALVARINADWGKPVSVVGTGGVASLFHGATLAIDHFNPDLTIRGMLEIYRRNRAAKA
jgi:type III pantothenate kinase